MRSEGKRQTAVRAALLVASFAALSYMGFRALAENPEVQAALPISEQPAPAPAPERPDSRRSGFILRETMRLDEVPTAVAFSRTGDALAVGLRDGRVRTWDANTGARKADLGGTKGGIAAVTLGVAGRRVAAVDSEGSAYVWDAAAGGAPKPLSKDKPARLIRFSENGQRVAVVADDGSVQVKDLESGESWSFAGSKRVPKALAFSPAGPLMAVSDVGRIALWGVGLTEEREDLQSSGIEAEAIAFSSNGLELAAGIGRQIVTWDMPTRRASRTYTLSGKVRALAHRADVGWIAVTDGSKPDELRIWRVHEGRAMTTIHLQHPAVILALSSNGERLAAGTAEAEVYCWDTLPPPRR
jgi:WD40 repeat protein